ncbi:hypothetical protein [Haloimpatiens massiliensis]|uniref:hypothetical protein n=1 Tax=Haloimpatiens massiliensis TaxID=1658110 RepID=UPI000C831A05|nr:hypothetical protein [Haloimpatiens massiliensis]
MKIYNGIAKRTFVIILIFSVIYNFLSLFFYSKNIETINDFITFAYGYVDLWHINNIVNIVYWVLPQLILIIYLGDYIEVRLLNNAALIFTRTNMKINILLKFIRELFMKIYCFYLLQFILVLIIGGILGVKLFINTDTVFMMTRVILYNFLIILIVNSSSILYKSIYGVYLVLIIQLGMLYLSKLILNWNKYFLKYLFTTNTLLSLNRYGIGIDNHISLLYLFILILVVLIITLKVFKEKEILY